MKAERVMMGKPGDCTLNVTLKNLIVYSPHDAVQLLATLKRIQNVFLHNSHVSFVFLDSIEDSSKWQPPSSLCLLQSCVRILKSFQRHNKIIFVAAVPGKTVSSLFADKHRVIQIQVEQ
eukprot:Filipodium_phascolosomae@DN5118_c0_g1_i1.p1